MKKTTQLLLSAFTVLALLFTACKKDPGPQGPTGPQGPQGPSGPSAKTYTYTCNFTNLTTYASYNGIMADFTPGDMVLTFIYWANYGDDFYVQLPFNDGTINYYAEVSEATGYLFLNTDKANGTTGSPWASNVTLKFKSILIRSDQIKKGVNHASYSEVKKAYNLKD